MRYLAQSYQGVSRIVLINTDRFLTPLLIVCALTLAGWVLSLS